MFKLHFACFVTKTNIDSSGASSSGGPVPV